MRADFKKLIDKIISNLDWDSIYEIHKTFKLGVGEGSEVIPGLKRKVYSDKLTKNDVRAELRTLLRFVVDNDISKLVYGQWMIFWFNQDWEIIYDKQDGEDMEEDDEIDDLDDIKMDSRLEVVYSPQRICLTVNAGPQKDPKDRTELGILSEMMKNAIKKENYELAKKIKDILDLTNTSDSSDK